MTRKRLHIAVAIPVVGLLLAGCVSQEEYNRVVAENQRLQAAAREQAIVEPGDLLFPEGGWRLGPAGRERLNLIVPQLQAVHNAKIVVYGYTDNVAVGPELMRQGIANNQELSSKRADQVVTYLASQGVNPALISAKGRGDTHPVASNDTPEGRAQNRRIEIVLEGPGA